VVRSSANKFSILAYFYPSYFKQLHHFLNVKNRIVRIKAALAPKTWALKLTGEIYTQQIVSKSKIFGIQKWFPEIAGAII
jgi:hypothetical protein